jgi:hypothetical protein
MCIPGRIPGLKVLTILFAVYVVIWMGLEGSLPQVILMAGGTTFLGGAYLFLRRYGGRWLSFRCWLITAAIWGGLMGLSCGLLALLFMAVKTGLHSHGPEFTPAEIDWVLKQLPIWSAAGLLAGLGLGLVALYASRNRQ